MNMCESTNQLFKRYAHLSYDFFLTQTSLVAIAPRPLQIQFITSH